jgi:HEAT repeat protein
LLLEIAGDENVEITTRARAVGSIEADEPWERDELIKIVRTSAHSELRVAAAQTLGAFAPLPFVLEHLAFLADDPSAASRAALLWALQLAARPDATEPAAHARAEALVRRALADADPSVRRRAAYVAGNLDAASLVPDLVELARNEPDRTDLRVAAFVGLSEIGSPARFTDLVFLWNREDDPQALAAASRAIERSLVQGDGPDSDPASAPPSLARVHDRLRKLLGSSDSTLRAAAARVAGLSRGSVPVSALVALADDPAPRVREQAAVALGRLGGVDAGAALAHALADADPAVQERAAEALLSLGSGTGVARVLDFVARAFDRAAALRVALHIVLPNDDREAFLTALDAALDRVGPDHPVYEPLLGL